MPTEQDKPKKNRSLSDPATLQQFASKLGEGIYISTPDGAILDANQAFVDMVGVGSVEELKAIKAHQLMDPARRSEEEALLESHGSVRSFEFELKRPDGGTRYVRDTGYVVRDEDTGELFYHGILVDISAQKALEQQLVELSVRDPLTGCYNRRYFAPLEEKLQAGSVTTWGCIYLDIDDFKVYNDHHGHSAGDAALLDLSRFLLRQLRGNDVVVRVGGDEFVAVLPTALEAIVLQVVQRLQASAASAHVVPFSMGWCARQEDESLAGTVDRADQRLISVKVLERKRAERRKAAS
ncbi:MAG TPA: sensor domain-containing diguanylate cyclase [Gemmatimonadaceae bacterium]|nr:sensor domain-containing diguanylate cyclase [Gemmatimonadaceae bacterium]